jgi:cell wall-associated NlpC family hydrolase
MSYDPGFDGVVGALPLNAPQAPTAGHKLKLSRLKLTQMEMLGHDVDLTKFYASFNDGGVDLLGAMTDANVERTVQGASVLTCTITDEYRILLNSGLLSDQLTVEIDGLFWMLVKVNMAGPTLTLTFNEREVVIARKYNKPIKQSVKTSRAKVTRAEFALRLLREIKELPPIPYVIPALKVPQPIGSKAAHLAHDQQRTHDKGLGIPKNNNLQVKSAHMSPEQRRNANQILDTGASMVLPRKYLVAAIMCTIQESSIINLRADQSPGGHVGCFQQDPAYWPASRNIPKDARAFYKKLGQVYAIHPNYDIATAVYTVQNPGGGSAMVKLYRQWQDEAEKIVDAYGVVPGGQGSAADANNTYNAGQGDVVYEFYRGRPPTSSYQKKHGDPKWGKENTWDCWQRLASEVQWRCFFVSGTFYFISEDDLFKQHPIVTIDHHEEGIQEIDGDYDSAGKSSDLTITCRMGRWAAPPGSVVEIKDHGPWDGRWLVNDVTRSLFNSTGTVILKKPLPALPEPDSSNVSTATGGHNGKWAVGGKDTGGGPLGETIVEIARKAMNAPGAGTSYEWGGTPAIGPGTHTDCSGFVLAVYRRAGITKAPDGTAFPRTSQLQYSKARMHPGRANLEPGDLVFFDYEGPHSHVGIYTGGTPSGHTWGPYIGDQHTGSGIKQVPIDWDHYDGAARYTRKH